MTAAGNSRGRGYNSLLKIWFDQGTLEYMLIGYGAIVAGMRYGEGRSQMQRGTEAFFKAMTSANRELREEVAQRQHCLPSMDFMHVLRGEERHGSLAGDGVWA